jgi:regulator of sigma E protease
VQLTYSRDGQQHKAVLNSVASKQWFFADRGILLPLQSKFRVAESWSEALMLGARETWDRFTEVLRVLARLLTGRLNIDSLAGPVGIFRAAGYEAHHGIPQLLLFLTMLSANLAIINFLPIPVLDGGHMVFLSWELIVGRPVDENIQTRLSIAGLLFLVALIAVVSFNDITRIFSG